MATENDSTTLDSEPHELAAHLRWLLSEFSDSVEVTLRELDRLFSGVTEQHNYMGGIVGAIMELTREEPQLHDLAACLDHHLAKTIDLVADIERQLGAT